MSYPSCIPMSFWSTSINLRMQFLRHGFAVGGGVPKSPQHRTPSIGFAQHVARKAVGPVGFWWCFQGFGMAWGWPGDTLTIRKTYTYHYFVYINVYIMTWMMQGGTPMTYETSIWESAESRDLPPICSGCCFFNPFPVMREWNKHEIPT